jgi:hypothetical protein
MIKDIVKKYSGVTYIQDTLSKINIAEKKGTGLIEEVKANNAKARKYIEQLNNVASGKTEYKKFDKSKVKLVSQKQNCCECVFYSFDNIQKKFMLNRGYNIRDYELDTILNYTNFNVKKNAMVGAVPMNVYSEFNKNGYIPLLTEQKKGKFKE